MASCSVINRTKWGFRKFTLSYKSQCRAILHAHGLGNPLNRFIWEALRKVSARQGFCAFFVKVPGIAHLGFIPLAYDIGLSKVPTFESK